MMSLGSIQSFCLWSGYYLNAPARQIFASGEKVDRYARQGEWGRVAKEIAVIAALILPAIPTSLVGTLFYVGASFGSGRFVLRQGSQKPCLPNQKISYLSLNTCFQYPYAPLTGGVEQPFDPVGRFSTRIEFVANRLKQLGGYDVIACQEVENLRTQKEFAERLVQRGYSVLYDTGANSLLNPSGLLIAFYGAIEEWEFIPYSSAMRVGLASWSQQGALAFKTTHKGRELWIATTHLNYGDGRECEAARQRQLDHLIKKLSEKHLPFIILGDLNSHALKLPDELENAMGDEVTCTDAGKHRFRKPKPDNCPDCEERIDAVVNDPSETEVTANAMFLEDERTHEIVGSDHALIYGEISLLDQDG